MSARKNQARKLFAIVLGVISAATAPWSPRVSAQGGNTVIRGCLGEEGRLRVLGAVGGCRRNESPISWNSVGPMGPAGVAGAAGPAGPAGPEGPAGRDGRDAQGSTPPAPTLMEALRVSTINNNDPTPILAFSLGASNPVVTGTGGGAGAGKVDFSDLSITKSLDAASLELLKAAATGMHIPTAEIEVSEVGASSPFAKYRFSDVLVTADVIGANGNAVNEQVSMNFARIAVDVTIGGQTFHSCYDIRQAKTC